jgi:hypothetical protein
MTVRKYIRYRLHRLAANRLSPLPLPPARKLTRARTTHSEELFSRALLRSSAPLRCWLARTRGAQQSILLPNCAHMNFSSLVVEILKLLLLLLMRFLGFLYFVFWFQFEEVVARRCIWSISSPS